MKIKLIILHIILPLLAGVLIYILFRKPVTTLHLWLGLQKSLIVLTENWWTERLLFQVPDMCWAYAFTAALLLFTKIKTGWIATICLLFLSAVEWEQAGFQLLLIDRTDLIAMILAVFLPLTLLQHERHS